MKIHFKNPSDIHRINEPVSFGLPLPEGWLTQGDAISVTTERGRAMPFGHKVTARWKDGSIKWLLLDIQVSLRAGENMVLEIGRVKDKSTVSEVPEVSENLEDLEFQVHHREDRMEINSGNLEAVVNTRGDYAPFYRAAFGKNQVFAPGETRVVLTDADGERWSPFVDQAKIEHDTRLRKTIFCAGRFQNARISHFLRFFCRIHFFRDTGFVKFEFTIHNSKAAVHQGGAWDLGDDNAFFFRELAFVFDTKTISPDRVFYSPEPDRQPVQACESADTCIYQESSGHENWQSKNHMNKEEKIPLRFRGYQVQQQGRITVSGDHAAPLMGVAGRDVRVFARVKHFWQNFPKALAVENGSLCVGLFPGQFNDLFELQPGEQKTHTFYVGFGEGVGIGADADTYAGIDTGTGAGTAEGTRPDIGDCLAFVDDPLVPQIDCAAYHQAMLRPRPVPAEMVTPQADLAIYDRMLAGFVGDTHGYEKKNIRIDEFGWRNFGDLFADHEAVFSEGKPFISHYNNQYDVIKGALLQFMRTGKKAWFTLAKQLADHVYDIDIYHTSADKYQYNHGLFWHTDHHLDAHTATHRTISRAHRPHKKAEAFGGGPSTDHNYATGFVYLYWMTGHPKYKDAVTTLAGYIMHMLDGPDTLAELGFQAIRDLQQRVGSLQNTGGPVLYVFDGPCRASGNSLNTLLDGYVLTADPEYLRYAERLISTAIHPEDDLDRMELLNAEIRWFYTVFLQALGRYLDIKAAEGSFDDGFCYARQVLLHYARWMLENEYPYLEKPEILEFPNETWAAQDLRKSDIFALASYYTQDEAYQHKFKKKAHFFFNHAVKELDSHDTKTFTRPMVLLMTNGMSYLEMTHLNAASGGWFHKIHCRTPAKKPCRSTSLLQRCFKNLTHFSLKKEIAWVVYQIRSRL